MKSKSILLSLLLTFVFTSKVSAATLKFNTSSLEMDKGDKKSVTVVLDTEGKKVYGAIVTVKITSGSDKIQLGGINASSNIGFNQMKLEDNSSTGDSVVSFTVINEALAFFTGVVNLGTLEVTGLKDGNAKFEVVTTGVVNPSSVSDYDTASEILTSMGSVSVKVNDDDDSNNDDDDDEDEDDNDNNSSSSGSTGTTATPTTTSKGGVPQTGSNEIALASLMGLLLAGGSLVARKFIKA